MPSARVQQRINHVFTLHLSILRLFPNFLITIKMSSTEAPGSANVNPLQVEMDRRRDAAAEAHATAAQAAQEWGTLSAAKPKENRRPSPRWMFWVSN